MPPRPAPASAPPLRWLHLSDLHLGCPGHEHWHQMEEELR